MTKQDYEETFYTNTLYMYQQTHFTLQFCKHSHNSTIVFSFLQMKYTVKTFTKISKL